MARREVRVWNPIAKDLRTAKYRKRVEGHQRRAILNNLREADADQEIEEELEE